MNARRISSLESVLAPGGRWDRAEHSDCRTVTRSRGLRESRRPIVSIDACAVLDQTASFIKTLVGDAAASASR